MVNSRHHILKSKCCLVWKHIIQKWSSSSLNIKQYLVINGFCKVPVCTDNGDIHLCRRDKAFVPDDLQLKDLFKRGSARLNFTWKSNPSNAEIPFGCVVFNWVKNIWQAISIIKVLDPKNMHMENLTPRDRYPRCCCGHQGHAYLHDVILAASNLSTSSDLV